jgi:hypothetical protein
MKSRRPLLLGSITGRESEEDLLLSRPKPPSLLSPLGAELLLSESPDLPPSLLSARGRSEEEAEILRSLFTEWPYCLPPPLEFERDSDLASLSSRLDSTEDGLGATPWNG